MTGRFAYFLFAYVVSSFANVLQVVSLSCYMSFRLRVISRCGNVQKVVLRNDLTRKQNDSRRFRTGRRRNDGLAKHTGTVYIFSVKSSELKSYMYMLKTLFSLLRKQSIVPTMFIFVKSIFSNLLR